jgi:Flp pilus assembly protein TadD
VESPYLAFLREGDVHAERTERSAAVAAYKEAARFCPQEPDPYWRMAQVALEWERLEDARAMARTAGGMGASREDVERLVLETYIREESWDLVAEHASGLLAALPADRDTWHALARAQICLGEWQAAEANYRSLLTTDYTDYQAHEGMGILLLGVEPVAIEYLFSADTELARDLLGALKAPGAAEDPVHVSVLAGRTLFEHELWCEAALHFERVVEQRPADGEAHAYLGYAMVRAGRASQGALHLSRAVALAPESAVAHMLLGLHHDRNGALVAARTEYEAAYELDPDNPAICLEIGETWAAERRYLAAEIWLRQAVALEPDDPVLWEALVRFYVANGMAQQASEAAAQLVELAPNSASAHDLQGWAAFSAGNWSSAEENLRRAIVLEPTFALAHFHLGRLWQGLGAAERAEQAFARAFDLDTTGEIGPMIERATGEQHHAGFHPGDE